MIMMTESPVELFDEVVVGPGGTADGELLARLNDAPAGRGSRLWSSRWMSRR
jgi:hypothetical protein